MNTICIDLYDYGSLESPMKLPLVHLPWKGYEDLTVGYLHQSCPGASSSVFESLVWYRTVRLVKHV